MTLLVIVPCSPPRYAGELLPCSLAAVAGLVKSALSHVIFVIGLGNSCSQPLFAKRPSRTHGSRRNASSIPELGIGDWGLGIGVTGDAGRSATGFGVNAVLGITPSCSHLRQFSSLFGSTFHCSRMISYAERSGRSLIAATTSCADFPP